MARASGLVDCDLHAVVSGIEVLEPYLDDHWREVVATSQFKGPSDSPYPAHLPTTVDPQLTALDGAAPGATLGALRAQALDPLGTEVGILTCSYGVESVRNPDAAAAVAGAVNAWMATEWLAPEPRLRGTVVLPSGQPAMAAEEVHRVGGGDAFVAVHLPVRSALPYGNRIWWPLLEAVTEHDLVLGLHFGGAPGLPPTASGWPTFHVEEVVDMASAFQSQLTSLVAEGAFDRFPTLRVALLESGWSWLPAFLWRFDKSWRGLRREVPWTRHLPSEYVREHVRIGLQPADGPPSAAQLQEVVEQVGAADLLLFASDYPHGHQPRGLDAVPAGLDDAGRHAILSANARAFYRLPEAPDV